MEMDSEMAAEENGKIDFINKIEPMLNDIQDGISGEDFTIIEHALDEINNIIFDETPNHTQNLQDKLG